MSTNPQVELTTNLGVIKIELDAAKAPKTVENFLAYVRKGHYDGTIFHRVIKRFMIQGGGFDASMNQKPTDAAVENESANGLQNLKYTLAMARTNAPHSATAQFFINAADNAFLDRASSQDGWGYAVFGKVVEGTAVVDEIEKVRTSNAGFHRDVPVDAVVIERAVELS
ncbi:peptidylprolyl isomerase [Roseateles paludis]|jgi:peptidyl-prolyl cis-trans isomerase B (cyclophilin B)|uniref:Peptidyl-prolyl cis-trans isomerase n=1 Tax=Roseateles paludis TaxID=3145238 RepID=A0ABV0G114_9BURK